MAKAHSNTVIDRLGTSVVYFDTFVILVMRNKVIIRMEVKKIHGIKSHPH
jgi:hypothetical protein